MHFCLLWGLFEGIALKHKASSLNIRRLVEKWHRQDCLRKEDFAAAFEHFKGRYFASANSSQYFPSLNLRPSDMPELVRAVLAGDNTNLVDEITVLLIIVYRLRNNLFHGMKWVYGIRDQFDNFN